MSKVSVKSLVLEYLNSKDEGSDRFLRLFNIARLQGMRKFNMDVCGSFKTVLLSIGANGVVPFPLDYENYVQIGIVNECGEGVPLQHNEDIIPIKQAFIASQNAQVGAPTIPGFIDQLSAPGWPLFWLNYQDGSDYYHLYGIGGGAPRYGEFSVDDNARCFLINPGFPYGSILVEYLTNGFDCDCNQYMIHTFAADAFMAWLRWKDNIDKKGVSQATIRSLKIEWANEKKMARLRLNPVRIQEMQRVFRHHTKLVARA
jgi:hypothetical protein